MQKLLISLAALILSSTNALELTAIEYDFDTGIGLSQTGAGIEGSDDFDNAFFKRQLGKFWKCKSKGNTTEECCERFKFVCSVADFTSS